MIYVVEFREGHVKFGFATDVAQRLANGFNSNSHPRALCNKLVLPWFKLIALYEGSEEEEKELHKQFNEGELKRDDCANEFYELSELPKILRELDTHFKSLPLVQEFPAASLLIGRRMKTKRPCCLGRAIACRFCGTTSFCQFWNRHNHETYNCHKNPNRQTPPPCKFCGKILSDPDGVKKHENHHCPQNQDKTERPDKNRKL